MKKFLVSSIMFLVVAVGVPLSVEAHNGCSSHRKARKSYASRNYRARSNNYRNYNSNRRYSSNSYSSNGYSNGGYVTEQRPSFYRRHRNVINMAIGTGGGAVLGGLFGGRRGAGIGALSGLGGSALYTYKLNPKKRRYHRRY